MHHYINVFLFWLYIKKLLYICNSLSGNRHMTKVEGKYKALQSHEVVIRHFIDIKAVDALAFFYLVKARFTNSTIFDYSPQSAAEQFNLTPYLVEKYVRQLRKEGLVRKNKKNLTFVGRPVLNDIFELDVYYTDYGPVKIRPRKCTLFISQEDSLKDVKLQLLSKILQQKITQQEYIRSKKADCKKTSCRSKFETRNETLFDVNVLSYRSIAKTFKMALSTCHKVIKEMASKGYIKIKTIKFVLEVSSKEAYTYGKEYLDRYFGYTFFNKHDRCIWAVPGSTIEFPYYSAQKDIRIKHRSLKSIRLGMTKSLFT